MPASSSWLRAARTAPRLADDEHQLLSASYASRTSATELSLLSSNTDMTAGDLTTKRALRLYEYMIPPNASRRALTPSDSRYLRLRSASSHPQILPHALAEVGLFNGLFKSLLIEESQVVKPLQ